MKYFLVLSLPLYFVYSLTNWPLTSNKAITSPPKEKVHWISLTEAAKLSETEKRKVIVDVYADWCGWCKKMDKTTFSHPEIAEYINENFYAVKLDAETKKPITIGGKTYKYKTKNGRGSHELALALLDGRVNLPSVVVLDTDFNKISIIPGYMNAPDFDRVLHYFGDGFHDRGIAWRLFETKYKSKLK